MFAHDGSASHQVRVTTMPSQCVYMGPDSWPWLWPLCQFRDCIESPLSETLNVCQRLVFDYGQWPVGLLCQRDSFGMMKDF